MSLNIYINEESFVLLADQCHLKNNISRLFENSKISS